MRWSVSRHYPHSTPPHGCSLNLTPSASASVFAIHHFFAHRSINSCRRSVVDEVGGEVESQNVVFADAVWLGRMPPVCIHRCSVGPVEFLVIRLVQSKHVPPFSRQGSANEVIWPVRGVINCTAISSHHCLSYVIFHCCDIIIIINMFVGMCICRYVFV